MTPLRYPGAWARSHPDHVAQIVDATGERTTYRELDERSNRIAHLLRGAGLRRGDHVAIVLENHPRFLEVVWAALRSGLYFTPVNPQFTGDEVAVLLDACEANAVFASGETLATAARGARGSQRLRARVVVDAVPALPDGWQHLDDATADLPATPIADESEGAPMWYSSGTTGSPKGVHGPLPEGPIGVPDPEIRFLGDHYGFSPETVHLALGPLCHGAPLAYAFITQRFGGTVVLTAAFDAEMTLRAIEHRRVTTLHAVPTMFVRMLKLPRAVRERYDHSSLRTVIHGAAPCPVDVKRAMIDWWGPIVWEYYSGTEGHGSTLISTAEWLEHPGSVGRARRGVIHIVDDDGNELSAGETGTVYFENPAARSVYFNDPDGTAAMRDAHSWATLGDVGHLDDEGYLYLTDRWAFKIVSGGVNIYPRQIEDVLLAHPQVWDVAVIPVPEPDLGEAAVAVVQVVPGTRTGAGLSDELTAWCRARLAAYKVPKRIVFDPELPRQDNGKLYKHALRERYRDLVVTPAAPAGAPDPPRR
ncbi:MAG: AMP-binding protein [Actinobacteria bacterium]|nr:AMP-binding protein [Actinomycetota bacterium]